MRTDTMMRVRIHCGSFLLLVACGSSGNLAQPPRDGGADDAAHVDAGSSIDAAESGPRDGAAESEAGPAPCGALGQSCCAGATCMGGLVCSGNVCGCASSGDCGGNGACTSGHCLFTIAVNQSAAIAIAVNATHLVWANATYIDNTGRVVVPGYVMKAPLDGGAPGTLVSGVMTPMGQAFAADATTVYWIANAIAATPIGGGPTQILGQDRCNAMAVDATSLYCTDFGSTVTRTPLGGGAPATLASTPQGNWTGILAHGSSVYWNAGGSLEVVPVSGGIATAEASGLTGSDIASNASAVYWTTSTGIGRLSFTGGAPNTVSIAMNAVRHIAVDEGSIYWTDGYDGTVMKAPLGGGAPTTLYRGDIPLAIAVDQTSVYWTSPSGGTVMRLSPK